MALAKIDAHLLEALTLDKITNWKRGHIARAGQAPVAIASVRRTVISCIHRARSLFSPSILKALEGLTLPVTPPLTGVELGETGSTK